MLADVCIACFNAELYLVFVKSLKKVNEDVNQHVSMSEHGRRFNPRLGMLVLAKQPCDGLYVVCRYCQYYDYCCCCCCCCCCCYNFLIFVQLANFTPMLGQNPKCEFLEIVKRLKVKA